MEPINTLLEKLVVESERPTRESPVSTLALEKLSQFQTLNDPQLEHMKIEAARFVTDFRRKNKPRWISLLGTSGSGKTMLAKMIGSLCFRGWIDKWGEIVRLLRDGEHRRFYDLSNEEFLVIDDICAEYETDFIKAKMYEFLSLRENRWTVLTANLSIQQIGERFDPRIASRMIRHGSAVVDVDVMDFNLRRSIPQTFDDVRKIMKGDQ